MGVVGHLERRVGRVDRPRQGQPRIADDGVGGRAAGGALILEKQHPRIGAGGGRAHLPGGVGVVLEIDRSRRRAAEIEGHAGGGRNGRSLGDGEIAVENDIEAGLERHRRGIADRKPVAIDAGLQRPGAMTLRRGKTGAAGRGGGERGERIVERGEAGDGRGGGRGIAIPGIDAGRSRRADRLGSDAAVADIDRIIGRRAGAAAGETGERIGEYAALARHDRAIVLDVDAGLGRGAESEHAGPARLEPGGGGSGHRHRRGGEKLGEEPVGLAGEAHRDLLAGAESKRGGQGKGAHQISPGDALDLVGRRGDVVGGVGIAGLEQERRAHRPGIGRHLQPGALDIPEPGIDREPRRADEHRQGERHHQRNGPPPRLNEALHAAQERKPVHTRHGCRLRDRV